MTAQKQYEQAERLAREADRNGGPLPVALLQEAAAAKYPPAVYALANWHLHGKGVKRDYKKAVELLKMAAAKKHPAAEYDLAVSYELGKGGLPKDPAAALIWYRRAANDGDLDATTEVARCYYYGIGTRQNRPKAVEWYRKAAERGNMEAQYALGRAYELGEGVEPNVEEAVRWYKKAAAQGGIEADKAATDLAGQERRGR